MDPIVAKVVTSLAGTGGVGAIVLGGSRARGSATPESDYDIGLYFSRRRGPLDLAALRRVVSNLADPGSNFTVTEPGEWGRWVVGGVWLRVDGKPVDLLYRDIDAVGSVIEDCTHGRLEVDYQPGHPHCFVSSIWMAEVAQCQVLHDADGEMQRLKAATSTYPSGLRQATISRFSWECGFAVANAGKAVARGDHGYIAGSLFRAFACMAHVLHALNGVYLMNEKGALALAARLPVTVPNLAERTDEVWRDLGARDYPRALANATSLVAAFEQLVASARLTEADAK